MKKIIILLAIASLSACSTTQTTQKTQVQFVQACASYNAAFSTALQLRVDGKLNASQIANISLIDSQITPICTGKLPEDTAAATTQIVTAITSLTLQKASQ